MDDLLHAVERLPDAALDSFAQRVLSMSAARRAPHLPHEESDLLRQINQGIAPDVQTRFDELVALRRAERLTPEQHVELLALTDQIEEHDARRLELLADLSRLRGISLKTLMAQMGLRPVPHD